MIRVVIADDQALIRDAIRAILEDAASGWSPKQPMAPKPSRPRTRRADVVLMDIRMPDMDGTEATRRISTSGIACRVLILTTFDFDRLVYDAMLGGATAFLLN